MLLWSIYSLPKVESVFEQVSGLLVTDIPCQTISVLFELSFRDCIIVWYYAVVRLYWCTLQLILAYKGAQEYPFYLLLQHVSQKSFQRFDATNPEISFSLEVLIVGGWKLVTDVSCWTFICRSAVLFQSCITHVFTGLPWCNWICYSVIMSLAMSFSDVTNITRHLYHNLSICSNQHYILSVTWFLWLNSE